MEFQQKMNYALRFHIHACDRTQGICPIVTVFVCIFSPTYVSLFDSSRWCKIIKGQTWSYHSFKLLLCEKKNYFFVDICFFLFWKQVSLQSRLVQNSLCVQASLEFKAALHLILLSVGIVGTRLVGIRYQAWLLLHVYCVVCMLPRC